MTTEDELREAMGGGTMFSIDDLIKQGRIKDRRVLIKLATLADNIPRLIHEIDVICGQLERVKAVLGERQWTPEDRLTKTDSIVHLDLPLIIEQRFGRDEKAQPTKEERLRLIR